MYSTITIYNVFTRVTLKRNDKTSLWHTGKTGIEVVRKNTQLVDCDIYKYYAKHNTRKWLSFEKDCYTGLESNNHDNCMKDDGYLTEAHVETWTGIPRHLRRTKIDLTMFESV